MSTAAEDIAGIERAVEHRPWPLPSTPWVLFQSWRRLLFAHWPVPPDRVRPLVPSPLTVEEFDGRAWVGLTPFRVVGLRLRGFPAIPGTADFLEMNLRTYVRFRARPGVFFFSLDAASRAAVLGARLLYRLPYRLARMSAGGGGTVGERTEHGPDASAPRPEGEEGRVEEPLDGGWIRYRSRRRDDPPAEFRGRYRPTGASFRAEPGTLEHFLTERYALYSVLRSGSVLRADIHHRPWNLRPAAADVERNTVPEAHGLPVGGSPLLHYAERQDTLVWLPSLVDP